MKEIVYYATRDGEIPYLIWPKTLDKQVNARILKRLGRLLDGNYGDCKKIDTDISELRFTFGSGYRVYFTERQKVLIIIIAGGDKSSQAKEIKKAKSYIEDIKERY